MKRPCQALAGLWVVDHLMSVSAGCFCARSACPPGGGGSGGMGACGRRWPGRAAGPAWACPRFPARGAAVVSGVQAGPQGRRRRRCAAALTLEGRPRSLPARPAAHRGRWRPRRVGAVRRGGMVAACATASLIYACRDRRSVFRRAGPRTDIGRWVAQGVRGDRPCRGVRPGAPPGLRGRGGQRGQLVISAHTNPASSRATAVTATGGIFPRRVSLA